MLFGELEECADGYACAVGVEAAVILPVTLIRGVAAVEAADSVVDGASAFTDGIGEGESEVSPVGIDCGDVCARASIRCVMSSMSSFGSGWKACDSVTCLMSDGSQSEGMNVSFCILLSVVGVYVCARVVRQEAGPGDVLARLVGFYAVGSGDVACDCPEIVRV
mgnify:CR=1 FL=1